MSLFTRDDSRQIHHFPVSWRAACCRLWESSSHDHPLRFILL